VLLRSLFHRDNTCIDSLSYSPTGGQKGKQQNVIYNLKFITGKGSAVTVQPQSFPRCLHRGSTPACVTRRARDFPGSFPLLLHSATPTMPATTLLSESYFISGEVLCQGSMTRIHEGLLNLFSIAPLLSSL
jgi:hypothetical protein